MLRLRLLPGAFQGILPGASGGAGRLRLFLNINAAGGKPNGKELGFLPDGSEGRGGGGRLFFLAGAIPGFQGKLQHPVPLKREKRLKPFPVQHGGKPESVVLPHEIVGNPVHRAPERLCLRRFRRGALEGGGHEHVAADFRNGAAREGKIQHAHFPGVRNVNAEFLPDLPQHTLEGRFPRLKLPAGTVHLSRADPPLLAYQENPSVLHHEH